MVRVDGVSWNVWWQRLNVKCVSALGLGLDELPDLTDLGGLYESDASVEEAWEQIKEDQELDWA